MFPQAGETVPRVRFEGFVEPWEMRKLGDIVNVNSGRDYKHLNRGKIPVYGTGGYMLSVDESLSDEDAIGIGRKGTINKPQLLKAPFWTVDTLFFITPTPSNELRFLFSLTQSIEWAKHDESTGVPSLSKINIENIVRYVPNYNEQKCIGSFFLALDIQIDIQNQKIEQLNCLKNAYLQKMFV
jgi:type I restriction enzyme S subunit